MRTRAATMIAVCSLVFTAGGAFAQAAERSSHIPPTISVDFQGGEVGDYIQFLAKAGEANIVSDNESRSISLGDVSLKSTSVEAALELLDGLTSSDGRYAIDVDAIHTGHAGAKPIYRIRAVDVKANPRSAPVMSHVWSLAQLSQSGLSAEAVLTAVETAIDLQSDLDAPTLKYHDDTQLLIARGHPQHIEMIEMVIDALEDQRRKITQKQDVEQNIAQLTDHAVQLEVEHKNMQAQLAAMMTEREQLAVRHDQVQRQAMMSEDRLAEAQKEIDRLRAQIQALTMEVQRARDKADQ